MAQNMNECRICGGLLEKRGPNHYRCRNCGAEWSEDGNSKSASRDELTLEQAWIDLRTGDFFAAGEKFDIVIASDPECAAA